VRKLLFNQRIRAMLSEADLLCHRLRRVLSDRISSSDRFETELVCREALANAIEHGCRSDSSKTVILELSVSDGFLSAQIEDNGDGWYRGHSEGTADQNPRVGGNGLKLIEAYTDQFEFKKDGRIFAFEKRVQERRHHG
jgi:serine/threonine-protein kinase RsbW